MSYVREKSNYYFLSKRNQIIMNINYEKLSVRRCDGEETDSDVYPIFLLFLTSNQWANNECYFSPADFT